MKSEDESYFVPLSRCSRKIGCNRAKTLRSFPSLEIGIEIVSLIPLLYQALSTYIVSKSLGEVNMCLP